MVYILLSTYNGAKYLSQMFSSLENQSYTDWHLMVRDDGSQDNSKDIVIQFSKQHYAKVSLLESNKNFGAKESFNLLISAALRESSCDYIMFADQDDIWLDNKIEKTVSKMKAIENSNPDKPVLIHTDLQVVDEDLNLLDNSFWHYEGIDPSKNRLNRLLLQNTITGCAMMINVNLAKLVTSIPSNAIMHDWWIGLIASQFGKIDFINESTILYRQHDKNDTGAKKFSYINIIKKAFGLFFSNELYKQLNRNIAQAKSFLEIYREMLDDKVIDMLENFAYIKKKSFINKRKSIIKYKLLKQGSIRNIGLLVRI